MATHIHLELDRGLAGDMFLAALLDLGANLEARQGTGLLADFAPLEAALQRAGVAVRVKVWREERGGLMGSRAAVEAGEAQPLRRLPDIRAVLERLEVNETVRQRSLDAFTRLAGVEAAAHGLGLEEVHFHELGAADTLVDIVGAFWGLEVLGVAEVTATPLPWFSGTVDAAHGALPLPAPATAALMVGKPVFPTEERTELVTPTGALLVDRLVGRFAPGPAGVLRGVGVGYGSREASRLRAFMHEADAVGLERVVELVSHLDHLTPEELAQAMERLMAAGALDVLHAPGLMKKGRPGGSLTLLCRPEDEVRLRDVFFAETLSLGIRRRVVERWVLPRAACIQSTPHGPVAAKRMTFGGASLSRPEFEALRELAEKTGRSVAQLRFLMGGEEGDEASKDAEP